MMNKRNLGLVGAAALALVLAPAAFAEPLTGDFSLVSISTISTSQEGENVVEYVTAKFSEFNGPMQGNSTGVYIIHIDQATGTGFINAVDHFVGTIGDESGTVDLLYVATVDATGAVPTYVGTATALPGATGGLADLHLKATFSGTFGVGGTWTGGNFAFGGPSDASSLQTLSGLLTK